MKSFVKQNKHKIRKQTKIIHHFTKTRTNKNIPNKKTNRQLFPAVQKLPSIYYLVTAEQLKTTDSAHTR